MTNRIFQTIFALSLIFVLFTPAADAANKPLDTTVLTVGSERFSGSELVYLAKTDPLLAFPLKTDLEKVNRVADIVLFALGAKDEGMGNYSDADPGAAAQAKQGTVNAGADTGDEETGVAPDPAFVKRWFEIQCLAFTYLNNASEGWDISERTLRKYYNAHRASFIWGETIKIGHIFTATEIEALEVYYEARRDFVTASRLFERPPYTGAESNFEDWVGKGRLPLPVENAVWKGKVGQIIGPVRSDLGWHIVKIHERRPARQLSFSEAESMVENVVVRTYLDRDLTKFRAKHPVSIDMEALTALGGLPEFDSRRNYPD